MHNLSGYVIFCEDIRAEKSGQLSYIGVYKTNRHAFDVDDDGDIVFSRFSMICRISVSSEFVGLEPQILIKVINPDQEEDIISSDTLAPVPETPEPRNIIGQMNITLEGIVAKPDSRIEVTLKVGEHEKKIGSFYISGKSESEISS